MNAASNTLSTFVFAALCACVVAAGATESADGASPEDAPVPVSTLTRAEVLAELEIWREAGLDVFAPCEAEADPFTNRDYQRALARYESLHASPGFSQRVERIARERGKVRTVASGR